MHYQTLTKKYRPQNFDEITGQKHVLNALIYALDQNQIHHSYIFTGKHGIGKTSLARILAKSMNCLKGISSKPCELCLNCNAIKKNCSIDVIEIDAASKTKIEDTREILENIKYMPNQGRFKIYIIDEAHMLSKYSFNALLKSLEEPPKHVKFILATTDIKKIPETILSRCLQFHLKGLKTEEICKQLQNIIKKENIEHEIEALTLISKNVSGSMRDAINLIDQVKALGNGKILTDNINKLLGILNLNIIHDIIKSIIKKDTKNIIYFSMKVIELGYNVNDVINKISEYFYNANIYKIINKIYNTDCDKTKIMAISNYLSIETIQKYYKTLIKSKKYINLAPTEECGLIMTLLQLYQDQYINKNKNIDTCQKINIKTNSQDTTNNQKQKSKIHSNNNILVEDNKNISIKITSENHPAHNISAKKNITLWWEKIKTSLKLKGIAMQIVSNSKLENLNSKNNLYTISIDSKLTSLITKDIQKKIEHAISNYLNITKIDIEFIKNNNNPIIIKNKTIQLKNIVSQNEKQIDNKIQLINKNDNFKKLKQAGFEIKFHKLK